MPDCKFSEGVVRLNWVAKWVAAWKRLKTIGLGFRFKMFLPSIVQSTAHSCISVTSQVADQ